MYRRVKHLIKFFSTEGKQPDNHFGFKDVPT